MGAILSESDEHIYLCMQYPVKKLDSKVVSILYLSSFSILLFDLFLCFLLSHQYFSRRNGVFSKSFMGTLHVIRLNTVGENYICASKMHLIFFFFIFGISSLLYFLYQFFALFFIIVHFLFSWMLSWIECCSTFYFLTLTLSVLLSLLQWDTIEHQLLLPH